MQTYISHIADKSIVSGLNLSPSTKNVEQAIVGAALVNDVLFEPFANWDNLCVCFYVSVIARLRQQSVILYTCPEGHVMRIFSIEGLALALS